MAGLPDRWELFLQKSGTDQKSITRAKKLLAEYRANGYLRMLPGDAVQESDAVFAQFYAAILPERVQNGQVVSPVANAENSSWMVESDFCFLNVRAVGPDPGRPGTFIDALKLLPLLRVNSIHLAPFFDCIFGNIYAIDSLEKINPELVHPAWAKAGLGEEEQLRLLLDAIHALQMTVGFDLEPHTSQFSRVVLSHPEYFRWLEIAPDRKSLAGGVDQDTMLGDDMQKAIQEKVKKTVAAGLQAAGLAAFDLPETPNARIKEVQGGIIQELIAAGLWTLPSHTWGGVGLPGFTKYNNEHNYPMFEYLDKDGEDQSGHAFGMLTPIRFASNLYVNTQPTVKHPARPWDPGIDFFAGIFPGIRKKFGFDFLRLDYVDHVFDSVLRATRTIPLSDRPTPYVLERVIHRAREEAPGLGAMAERMGYDYRDYASVGFDLVLGADVIRIPNINFIEDMILFQQDIAAFNSSVPRRASIQYAVDSHDTEHPGIDTDPAKFGPAGMLLRFFLARFGNCGLGRRSKYEVIGNQDLTTGLYRANNEPVSLTWTGNKTFLKLYHNLEDVYRRFRSGLSVSYIREYFIGKEYCIWYLDRSDGFRSRMACLCNPDMGKGAKKTAALRIFPFYQYGFNQAVVEAVDFAKGTMQEIPLDVEGHFSVGILKPGEVRLYWIHERGESLPGE